RRDAVARVREMNGVEARSATEVDEPAWGGKRRVEPAPHLGAHFLDLLVVAALAVVIGGDAVERSAGVAQLPELIRSACIRRVTRGHRAILRPAMADADLLSDPFGERQRMLVRAPMALLGARIRFLSNDRRLLELADEAFAGLPPHRLPRPRGRTAAAELRIVLRLTATPRGRGRSEPPPTAMQSGAGLLAG